MVSPAVPPRMAKARLSARSWRTTRPRAAPRANRTAISRRRAAARASSMLATLAQAMRRIRPTAAMSKAAAGVSMPSTMGWNRTERAGSNEALRSLSMSGYSWASRATAVSTCALASSTVRPGARRPVTNSQRLPRCSRRVFPGEGPCDWMPLKFSFSTIMSGVQNSGARPGIVPVNSAGATPTMVYSTPLSSTRCPSTLGLPASRRCQKPWLTMATGWVSSVRFSSGTKLRPSAGRTPRTSK